MRKTFPAVTRSVQINQKNITYKLRQSSRAKYMRLQINHSGGLEVVLPRGYKIKDAERFLLQKKDWILKHLKSNNVKPQEFLFKGKEIKVVQQFSLYEKYHNVKFENGVLHITSPSGSKPPVKQIYETWLKHAAKSILVNRTIELAERYNFNPQRITVRSQKTRWGSCSKRGSISLNYKLLKYNAEIIDYVIIHELCHLKELNHSKKFWELVEKIVPDYKSLKRQLKEYHPG